MSSTLTQERLDEVIAFHGHWCPGLAIGIRAAEVALDAFDTDGNDNLVTVTETDMCGVDAIQFLTSCTVGKGNLVQRDWGKIAFSFFDRAAGKGIRLLLNPNTQADLFDELDPLTKKVYADTATAEEIKAYDDLRARISDRFMGMDLADMFTKKDMELGPPRPPSVLQSLACDRCGEMCMESRTRRLGGKTYCIPCFAEIDQKL